MSVNFSCDTTQMTVSMNKREWICETCYQDQIHSLQWQIRFLFIHLSKEYLLSTYYGFGMALDTTMDKTKSLPYNALWCIPVEETENKQVNLQHVR